VVDTSLVFDLILKGRTKVSQGLKGVGKDFRSTGQQAEDALDQASQASNKLDSKIEEVERSLRELNQEFAATANTELLPKIRKERGLLRTLRKVREELDDVGDEAVKTGLKVGAAFGAATTSKAASAAVSGISGVFQSLPPQVQGAVLVAGAAVGLAFSTAIGAAVVAGILGLLGGGALVAGIIGAAKDPKVAKAWGAFGKGAKTSLAGFIEPFKGPMIRAATTFGDALSRMSPTLARIGQTIAPLIDDLAPALAAMAEKALPGIEKAMKASVPLFQVVAEHAPTIGEAVSKFFATVSTAAPAATLFMDHLLSVVEFLIPAIGFFFASLAAGYTTSVAVFVALGKGVLFVVSTIMGSFKQVADIAAMIPGPHQAAMRKVSEAIGKGIDRVNGLSRALDDLKRPRTATVSVRTAAAMEKLRGLNKKIASVVYDRTMGITVAVRGGGRIPERAHGGPVLANQPYIVGDGGREELFVPDRNGTILPRVPASTPTPMTSTSDGAAGGNVVTVRLVADGADREMLRLLRRMVRVEGRGNVQIALGQG